jgi:hypothetical protein
VKLWDIIMLCLKVRVFSWITISEQGATIFTQSGMPIVVAVYRNGKLKKIEQPSNTTAPVIPDFPPPEWTSPDGPPVPPAE